MGSTSVYEVVATALDKDDNAVARVRAISGYVKGKVRALHLLFEDSCIGKADLCGAGETCSGGSCDDAHVSADGLLPYRAGSSGGTPPPQTKTDAGMDSSQIDKDSSIPTGSKDASTVDGGPVEGIDASTRDATMVDAGDDGAIDASADASTLGITCDDCTSDADCDPAYTCTDWYSKLGCYPKYTTSCPPGNYGRLGDHCVPYTGGASGGPLTCEQWRMNP